MERALKNFDFHPPKASPYELQATRYVLENKTSNYG